MKWLNQLLGTSKSDPSSSQDTAPSRERTFRLKPLDPAFAELMSEHERTCWPWSLRQEVEESEKTRFGGHPIMGDHEDWPICADCNAPLSFLMQCNLDDVPDGAPKFGGGLVRLFYCMTAECQGMGGWDAEDPQNHVTVLRGKGTLRKTPKGTEVLPSLTVEWEESLPDYPHNEDVNIEDVEDQWNYIVYGQKFSGWPDWYQGPERPKCPQCTKPMRYVLQLVDDPETGFNFGGGTGHITQCPDHPDEFGFGWACG